MPQHRSRRRVLACHHGLCTRPVVPHSTGCLACEERGDAWEELCLCLSCGWVACSDDSGGRHARDHYEETDHPVVASPPAVTGTRWCYVHDRAV